MLNDTEADLLRQCEPEALAALDEDELIELHTRVRRARTKYSKLYRRNARTQVQRSGKRAGASAGSARTRAKAEGFEEALSAVSTALAREARRSAKALKAERLADARREPARTNPPTASGGTGQRRGTRPSHRTPASEKRRASTKASGARRQAARDAR